MKEEEITEDHIALAKFYIENKIDDKIDMDDTTFYRYDEWIYNTGSVTKQYQYNLKSKELYEKIKDDLNVQIYKIYEDYENIFKGYMINITRNKYDSEKCYFFSILDIYFIIHREKDDLQKQILDVVYNKKLDIENMTYDKFSTHVVNEFEFFILFK